MDFAISYSGGKDSALALYRMIAAGHRPVALITTINTDQERSWFHGIQTDLLQEVSGSLGIPLIACECRPDDYTQAFENSLKKAKQLGAKACVFGDIDIEDHRVWNEERCKVAGLSCVLPLWGEDREALTHEMISAGFKALIKIVRSDILDESFLGQTITVSLIQKIKAAGADVCGENGEYHTFVYDGPIFSSPIPVENRGIIDFGTHKVVDIVKKQ